MSATIESLLTRIETQFKIVAGIDSDVSHYPLTATNTLQTETNKDKSKKHGEVFTPLWLVDKMVSQISDNEFIKDKTTLDLCAGYGQFTIRMMRRKYNILGESFNISKFLDKTHNFAEYQFSSAYKLLAIFTTNINLYIGDARHLPKLDADVNGVYYYSEPLKKWVDVTEVVKTLSKLSRRNQHWTYKQDKCDKFVIDFKTYLKTIESGV